jgi:tungstate transport system permease protein
MDDIAAAFMMALQMVGGMDDGLLEIVGLSLQVSLSAVGLAWLIGLPLGAILAFYIFAGRGFIIVILYALMGLPPVVVGLVVYLVLSRRGPLGVLGLLFSPTAMILAQVVLVVPIITSLSRQVIDGLWSDYQHYFRSLGVRPLATIQALIWDGRFALMTAVLAGFGRASAEVGAVMIVGGNIDHVSRVMTTAITLEASKGDLPLALALGMILVLLTVVINSAVYFFSHNAGVRYVR